MQLAIGMGILKPGDLVVETAGTLTGISGSTDLIKVGIVANVEHESGFRPGVMGDSGTSGGLFQHHKSRLDKMKNFIFWNSFFQDACFF